MLLVSAFLYFAGHKPDGVVSPVDQKSRVLVGTDSIDKSVQNTGLDSVDKSEVFSESKRYGEYTIQDVVEVSQDRDSDFLIHRDSHPYVHYETNSLYELARGGDIVAMKELSVRFTEKANEMASAKKSGGMSFIEIAEENKMILDSYSEAERFQKMAVYYGDREFLPFAKEAFLAEVVSDDMSPKEVLLASLSYDNFIGIRGSKLAMIRGG
ncbi:hypothetical protein [Gilvimarinus chinensis]|uniref:hypothetical protein n=1 Tax=Gilvimarinus chinensis TaxID=396005 RepID=UPI0012FB770B|nr:hypothetical protein [Gilvimarinus chinensis]